MNPKPKPPMPGGEYTHVSDPGTPPLPPGIKVVGLIPVGDGGPGPLLPRVTKRKTRKPLLPSRAEVEKLPKWARVAFAARCARRVLPILRLKWPSATARQLEVVETAIRAAERCATVAGADEELAPKADIYLLTATAASSEVFCAISATGEADDSGAAYHTVCAARYAANVAFYAVLSDPDPFHGPVHALHAAVAALLRVTSDPRDLLIFRSDLGRLRELSEDNGWTDDTPVPPEVFGPLWPPGRVSRWARETYGPRE